MKVISSFFIRRWAKKRQDNTGKQFPVLSSAFGLIIIVPLILFFIIGSPLSFDYPALKGFNFKGGMVIRPEFIAMFLALTIYTAAFISETVRSGILSVTKGQREASASLGLKKLPNAKATPSKSWTVSDWPDVSKMDVFNQIN